MHIKALILLLTLIPGAAYTGEIHRWVDENGLVHYGDKPPHATQVETVAVTPNVYATSTVQKLPEQFTATTEVVMYSASWCGYCKQARNYFNASGIPFREYDVEKTRKGKRDYKRLHAQSVPVILVGGKRLNGFDESAFNRLYLER